MAKFGSLWVGNPPTRLERLSAQSFLDYGHEFHLFLYDLSYANLFSEKVIVHDARDLLPEDMIFVSRKEKSYAQFSDIFRVRMINEYDLIWVDLDNICLSSEWKWPDFSDSSSSRSVKAIRRTFKNPKGINLSLIRTPESYLITLGKNER